MIQIITVIAPLFLIIFVTAIFQYYKKLGDNWSTVLNDYALKIGLPVLIFSTLSKVSFSFSVEAGLIISNMLLVLGSLLLTFIIGKLIRLEKQIFRTMFICVVFGNTAYLGIPVLTQVYGEKIMPTATLIVAIYLFCLFTAGIGYTDYSMNKGKRGIAKRIIKNLLSNPLLLSVFFGIIIGSLHIALPVIVVKSLDMITASVTPTVLIVIGLFIGKSKLGKVSEWLPVLGFSLIKLMLIPAMLYYGAKFSGISLSQLPSSVIQAAMPLAITPFALADTYKLNKTFIARSIVLSTILAVISLPFWISLV